MTWLLHLLLLAAALPQNLPSDAEALWREGRRLESIETLEKHLLMSPADRYTRRKLVERLIAVHRYERALKYLEGVLDARPLRAQALYLLGRYREALELLDKTDPDDLHLIVRAHLRLGDHATADRWLERVGRMIGTEDPRFQVLEGQRLARIGRHAEAAATFRSVLDGDPYDAEALFGYGQALVRSDRREEGLAALRRHRELAPLLDELDFAMRGIDLAPLHAPNHAQLGDVERKLGRLERAESSYRTALRLATPEEVTPVALRLARLLAEDRADLDGALDALAGAALRVPDARLFVRRGDLLAGAGRRAEALESYEAARALRPTDEQILARIKEVRDAGGGGGL